MTLTIEEATEKDIELWVEKIKLNREYEHIVVHTHDDPDREKKLEAVMRKIFENDDKLREVDRTLKEAFAAAGIEYSGSKCKTAYNMYTYREIEREALRRYRKDM